MSLKIFLPSLVFFLWTSNTALAQLIADFDFEDPSNLLLNSANADPDAQAVGINEFARAKDGGIYTIPDPADPDAHQNINLKVPVAALQSPTGSIYIEVEMMCNEPNGWLFLGGPLNHTGIYHNDEHGFRVRYYTTDSSAENYVNTSFIGPPLEKGIMKKVAFYYNQEEGVAYLYVDGEQIWTTTDSQDVDGNFYQPTPGAPFYWHTDEEQAIMVGSHMNGDSHIPGKGSVPSLYRFRVSAEACSEITLPQVISDNIKVCPGDVAELQVADGADGTFHIWYDGNQEEPLKDASGNIIQSNSISVSTAGLEAGQTYTYYVANAQGSCESEKVPVTFNVLPVPEAPVTENSENCGPGAVMLTASGGTEGNYRWYNSENDVTPIPGKTGSTFQTASLSSSKTYYVAVVNENGCESARTKVEAIIHPIPEAPLPQSLVQCGSAEISIHLQLPANAEKPLAYKWYSKQADQSPAREENSGSVKVFVEKDTILYVSSSNGSCESARSAIFIDVNELPYIDAGEDITILKGESVQLNARGLNGEMISCTWEPHESLDRTDIPNPIAQPDISTTYIAKRIDSSTGCENSDTLRVFVSSKFPVPNAFSPNSDGRNDNWEIPNIENYPDCTIQVYNGWGNQIFYSRGYQQPWDGRFNGQELPSGTYYYVLQLSKEHEGIKGTVFLMR